MTFSFVETCEIMEESSPGFKSSDSFPALLNRFRQHLLISISTNKFPFYSLFSSLAGQWSSVRNSPQDFGRFSQIMSRSPRCDISTEISHSGYKVHDRAHCDKYSGKSSWSLDRDSGAAALMQGLCGREDKSCVNTRLGQKPRSQLLQTRCLKIFSAVIGDEFSQ